MHNTKVKVITTFDVVFTKGALRGLVYKRDRITHPGQRHAEKWITGVMGRNLRGKMFENFKTQVV